MLIEEAHDCGACYAAVCDLVGISLRTLQRWKKSTNLIDRRKGSRKIIPRKLSEETRAEVITVCTSKRFCDYSPHEIVPLLLNEGLYIASVSSFYRVLRGNNLQHHRSNLKPRKKSVRPPEKQATASDTVWCWDITWLPSTVRGRFYFAYVIIDIYDKFIVGWAIHEDEREYHSRDLFERTLSGRKNIEFLSLHSDNGSPMKGATLLAFLNGLNVSISFSRPRTSNDNPFIESFFKTLKYNDKYPLKFASILHAREWMASFVEWYNNEHLHSSIGYVTPSQMRNGDAANIFKLRNLTMEAAKIKYPERWGRRKLKKWNASEKVILNKEKK
jgi:transposase InsO family protein